MSEHLTHIAVYEDCARLAILSKWINEAFTNSLKDHPDIGLLASASRGNHLYAVPIIEKAKSLNSNELKKKENKMKLAASVGWITHRAADLQTKPLVKTIDYKKETRFEESEFEIYQDAVTWDKVYSGGKQKSWSENVWLSPAVMETGMSSHPAANAINVDETELLLAILVQRSLLEEHKFTKDQKDFEKWLKIFLERRQKYSEDYRVYIDAYQNPNPEKMQKYIYDTNFYNEDDELIRLARSLQKGSAEKNISINEAIEKAENQSHYAQALYKGMLYLKAANDFYEGRENKDHVYDTMDIQGDHRL
ncbi:hypothetical protein BH23BAC1_BH23BAC1_49830 [soil metagenome]